MPRREIAGQLHPDAGRQLRVQHGVGGRVVEAEADVGQLVRVDAIHHVRRGGIAMRQVLHLRGERGAEIELEALEFDARVLGRLEDVQPALVGGAQVLDGHRPPLDPGLLGFLGGFLFIGLLDRRGGRRRGAARRRGAFAAIRRLLRRERRSQQQQRTDGGGETKCGSHEHVLSRNRDKNGVL